MYLELSLQFYVLCEYSFCGSPFYIGFIANSTFILHKSNWKNNQLTI